ncbi:MAG: hypothetical protein ABIP30_16680 [Ferruginibacter sp.]
MSFNLMILLSCSILLPAVAALARCMRVDTIYLPVMACIFFGALNDAFSVYLVIHQVSNAINNNIYILLEATLLLWQFSNWGLFGRFRTGAAIVAVVIFAGWLYDYHNVEGIKTFHSFFRIGYGLLLVLASLLMIHELVSGYYGRLIKNAVFIFCSGFIIYFSFQVLTEIFMLYGLYQSEAFQQTIFYASTYSNAFVNLIYFIAILWIPRKPQYIMLPS